MLHDQIGKHRIPNEATTKPNQIGIFRTNNCAKDTYLIFVDFFSARLPEREGFSLLKSVNKKELSEAQEQVKSGVYKLPTGEAVQIPDKDCSQFEPFIIIPRLYEKLFVITWKAFMRQKFLSEPINRDANSLNL
jgi:hypothetical protein